MANWKKVVVSGSAPELANLQVDGLTASEVVIGGGSAGNLSTTAINGTGNIVATTAASGLVHSGSFSGSFEGSFSGDGTNLTGVTAEWDGTMFVGNVSGLASAQITGSGAAPSLILSGSTGNDLVVENNAEIKGSTKLGNAQTDTTTITGSLNVTGSNVLNGVTNFIGKSADNFNFDIKIGGPESIMGMHFDNLESGKNIGITFDSVASPNNLSGGLFHRDTGGADSLKLLMHDKRGDQNMVVITGLDETNIIGNKLTVGTNSADNNNTLSVAGNIKTTTGITSSNLTNDNLLVAGTNGEIESSGITFNGSALDLGSSNITTTGNGTFGGDVTISGDLAVAGTASFTHASNLDVADKYILLNSGSVGNSDSGGIVIQGPGQDIGDLFGYRSGSAKSDTVQRWGIASGFDAKTSADFTPSAFMSAVVVGTGNDPAVAGADYAQAGNMYIDTDAGYDGIWIYS